MRCTRPATSTIPRMRQWSHHGNIHDSVAFDEAYDKVTKVLPETKTIVTDLAYKRSHI